MIIRRETLLAALAATTPDDSRYFLQAVRIEPSADRVIATDGHVLLIATDRHPQADSDFPSWIEHHGNPSAPVLVEADTIRALLATLPKRPTITILGSIQVSQNGSEESATLAATDLSAKNVATVTDSGKQFPRYERVIPTFGEDKPSIRVRLGLPVLETLIKAAKAVSDVKHAAGSITFELSTKNPEVIDAIGVSIEGRDVTVTGCAMPMRM